MILISLLKVSIRKFKRFISEEEFPGMKVILNKLGNLLLAQVLLMILVQIKQSDATKKYNRSGFRANIYKQFRIGGKLNIVVESDTVGKQESLKRTSDIVCPDENQCAYRPLGNTCVKRLQKYRDPVGSLKKTFENHGRANLIFKSCNDHGFVKVFLNGIPIKAIARHDEAEFLESYDHYGNDTRESVGKNKMEANFDYKPGDVLTLKEEGRAGIKVFSLTITQGNDPSKCTEDRGNGFVPDDDCITCEKPPKQKCADGYIMDSSVISDPPNQCTKITCTNPDSSAEDNEYEEKVALDMKSTNGGKLLVGSAIQSPLHVLLGLKSIPKIVNGKVIAGDTSNAQLTLLKKLPVLGRKPSLNHPNYEITD